MINKPYKVFIVDDDVDLCEVMVETFESEYIAAKAFHDGSEMLASLDPEWNGVILSDLHMPKMDGFQLLAESTRIAPGVPFIVITGYGDVTSALKAVREGAFDFIEKPATPDQVLSVINRALKFRHLEIENKRLKRRSTETGDIVHRLLGRSRSMREVRKTLDDLSNTSLNVFIHGEMGTGKTLVATILHDVSTYEGELIPLKGADVANAYLKQKSLLELINDQFEDVSKIGTLFIEKITDIPLEMQEQLHEQIKELAPLRVLLSDQKPMSGLLDNGLLHSKLCFGLNPTPFELPPIRSRSKDALLLLEHFIRQSAEKYQRKIPFVTEDEVNQIKAYPWPGNVEEIRIVAERSVLGLGLTLDRKQNFSLMENLTYDEAVSKFETDLVSSALSQSAGRKGRAAEILGISRKRLYLKMKSLGMIK